LQSPLSAIRWGCARLKKTGGTLSAEQTRLVDGIARESKLLSRMIEALLLLARVEEMAHQPRVEDIFLRDFLVSYPPIKELFPDTEIRVLCPEDAHIETDRTLLETLFESMAVVIATAAPAGTALELQVSVDGGQYLIEFQPAVELSFLRDFSVESAGKDAQLVGGVPGLMLSLATSFAAFLGGKLTVQPGKDKMYSVSVSLPV
jgi:K+-sensing histidine kinase KdpD